MINWITCSLFHFYPPKCTGTTKLGPLPIINGPHLIHWLAWEPKVPKKKELEDEGGVETPVKPIYVWAFYWPYPCHSNYKDRLGAYQLSVKSRLGVKISNLYASPWSEEAWANVGKYAIYKTLILIPVPYAIYIYIKYIDIYSYVHKTYRW